MYKSNSCTVIHLKQLTMPTLADFWLIFVKCVLSECLKWYILYATIEKIANNFQI